jgi:CIC family chloride channel protein
VNLLALLVGVISGLGAVLFKLLISLNNYLFFQAILPSLSLQFLNYNFAVALLPALGGIIVGVIVAKFAAEAKGHGIPQVIECMAFRGGRIRYRVAAAKIIASSITIGSGGSAGKEGPIAQIGASFGSATGQLFKLQDKDVEMLVVCGLASGIAATFNAPLGGAIFGLEILFRRFELSETIPVLLSCVLGVAVSRVFFGDFATFYPLVFAPQPNELLLYTALGAVFGLTFGVLSTIWVKFYYLLEGLFDRAHSVPLAIRVALGGLLMGLIGLPLYMTSVSLYGDKTGFGTYGVGYEGIQLLLAGAIPIVLALILSLTKILCTSLTLGSGGSGGLLVPSIYIGAMFGGAAGLTLNAIAPGLVPEPFVFAAMGAATLFAGAYGAPVASMILIPEMSMSYNPMSFSLLLPLMLSCSLGHLTARRLLRGSTINTLSLEAKGIPLSELTNQLSSDMLEGTKVQDVMTKEFVSVHLETPLKEVTRLISRKGYEAYPVVDKEGLVGVVDVKDVMQVPPNKLESTSVKDVMSPAHTIRPEQSLPDAISKMNKQNVDKLVVIDEADKKPIGLVTNQCVLGGYEGARKRRSHAKQKYGKK